MLTIKVSSEVGCEIIDCIHEMLFFSVGNQVVTEQVINGVTVWVYPHSDIDKVFEAYTKAQEDGNKYALVRS